MNMPHLHIMLVHLPIVALPIGTILLGIGIWKNKIDLKRAGLIIIVVSALFGVAAYKTGEEAEEIVEEIQGVKRHDIHEHEEAAEFTFVGLNILGVIALLGLILQSKNQKLSQKGLPIALLGGLFVSVMLARTANLGGYVRHSEIKEVPLNQGESSK